MCSQRRTGVRAVGGVSGERHERSVLGGACRQRGGRAGEVDNDWVSIFERHDGEKWMCRDIGLAAASGCCDDNDKLQSVMTRNNDQ